MTHGRPSNPATHTRTTTPPGSPSEVETAAPNGAPRPEITIEAVDERHLDEAAARLMCDQHTDPYLAGDRFLQAAELLGLSTKFVWGVLAPSETGKRTRPPRYAQALMAVPSSGGTAMLFLSPPAHPRGVWRDEVAKPLRPDSGRGGAELAHHQRVALLEHACAASAGINAGPTLRTPAPTGPGVTLAQALIEPGAKEVLAAYTAAGFMKLGDLAYMRRSLSHEVLAQMRPAASLSRAGENDGEIVFAPREGERATAVRAFTVRALRQRGHSPQQIDTWLMQALDDSYIDTLDCPELCGLRTSRDVLESHRAVGQQDDRLWWVVFEGAGDQQGDLTTHTARGCVLLNATRESDAVELVYLGLGPRLRGRGLSRSLMEMALRTVWALRRTIGLAPETGTPMNLTGGVTCAVDTRNVPALALYERLGFVRFGVRVPMVRSLSPQRTV